MTPKFKAITTSGQWVESMTIAKGKIKRKERNLYMEIEPDNWKQVIPETVCVGFNVKGKTLFHGDQYNHGGGYFTTLQFKDGCLFSVYKHPEDGEEIPVFEMDFENAEYVGNIHDHLLVQKTEIECKPL